MKLTFGRKFLAMVLGLIFVNGNYIMTLFVYPQTLTSGNLILTTIMNVTIVFMYVGGNVWNKWVKSKYFNKDILESDEK